MSLPVAADRMADTAAPIADVLAWRWSPRSFDAGAEVTDEQVLALLEAMRWAPSAANMQPRRFIVGKRGTRTFDDIERNLTGNNRAWAPSASLLILAIVVTAVSGEDDAPKHPWAEYDTGQAMANCVVQAQSLGLHAHQMGGLLADEMRAQFSLPSYYRPISVTAVGKVAGADLLSEELQVRETAARTRLPLDELILQRD